VESLARACKSTLSRTPSAYDMGAFSYCGIFILDAASPYISVMTRSKNYRHFSKVGVLVLTMRGSCPVSHVKFVQSSIIRTKHLRMKMRSAPTFKSTSRLPQSDIAVISFDR
jgi:hypothetical protein